LRGFQNVLGIDDLKTLREAYSAYSDVSLADSLRQIDDPSDEAIVAFAVKQMTHLDRNARVLALRVLAHQRGEQAMRGVLAGLRDEKRRVCAVAIQACPRYLEYEDIVLRLEAIVRASRLKRKLRRRALSMLSGNEGGLQGDLTPAATAAIGRLMAEREYRFSIVFGLARLDLRPRVKSLLGTFAGSEDSRERELAERALRGERVIHIDRYATDEAMQRRIMGSCDLAHGRMYYWLPREDICPGTSSGELSEAI
jgi:HEAT repeat protein